MKSCISQTCYAQKFGLITPEVFFFFPKKVKQALLEEKGSASSDSGCLHPGPFPQDVGDYVESWETDRIEKNCDSSDEWESS